MSIQIRMLKRLIPSLGLVLLLSGCGTTIAECASSISRRRFDPERSVPMM